MKITYIYEGITPLQPLESGMPLNFGPESGILLNFELGSGILQLILKYQVIKLHTLTSIQTQHFKDFKDFKRPQADIMLVISITHPKL